MGGQISVSLLQNRSALLSLSVDLSERRITAAVGELTGDGAGRVIGLGGSGLSRLWLGQELHRRKQNELEASEPGFESEVPISTEIEIDGWNVSLVGRADGVLYDEQTPVRVDEIKTLHFAVDLHGLYAAERPVSAHQRSPRQKRSPRCAPTRRRRQHERHP